MSESPHIVPQPAPAPAAPRMSEPNDAGFGEDSYVTSAPGEGKATVYARSDMSDIDRMIVRTGDIAILVENIPVAVLQITQYAQSVGGYVVSSNTWREDERVYGNISIRVPAANFDGAMSRLRDIAFEVVSESTSSQDVTEEYTDLSSKLKNLEATEEQLLKLMDKAQTVEEILSIQRELTQTRQEIELIKGGCSTSSRPRKRLLSMSSCSNRCWT
jgi:hypothetical protein